MTMLFAKKKDYVGIDIGSTSIKLVQLRENKGGGYQLLKFGVVPLPAEAIVDNTLMDSASIVEAIRHLLDTQKVKATDAVCSVAGNSVIIRKITVPAMSSEELEDQIQWEAEQYIPFDINDVNLDFQILSSEAVDSGRMNVLLVASKKDIIGDYTAVFAEAGVPLAVMDVDAFALQNIFEINYETGSDEVVALVNVGASMTTINIVKDGTSLFTRDVQVGGGQFTEDIQKQFGISGVEAEKLKLSAGSQQNERLQGVMAKLMDSFALEIRRSLEFYNTTAADGRIEKLYLAGGGAKTSGLPTLLQERLGIPVEIINPFKNVTIHEKEFPMDQVRELAPVMAIAAGLATRRLGDK
jgi:type IV pilus assembly protein PilM